MDTRIRDIDEKDWENFKKATAVFNFKNKTKYTLNGMLKLMIKLFNEKQGLEHSIIIDGVDPTYLGRIKALGKEPEDVIREYLRTYGE